MNLSDLRREYSRAALDESSVLADPLEQFRTWFVEAQRAEVQEPNAMTLATADAKGQPSARIVLLKGVDETGFVFFTDYRSRKGRELGENPHAALVFHWAVLERQVRVTGHIERLDEAASFAYFSSRPEGARIGAWASHQSERLPDRSVLERRVTQVAAEFAGREIPLPPHWGGYRLTPQSIEFWQGRENRLHDRIEYTRDGANGWQRGRLSP